MLFVPVLLMQELLIQMLHMLQLLLLMVPVFADVGRFLLMLAVLTDAGSLLMQGVCADAGNFAEAFSVNRLMLAMLLAIG